VWANGHEALSTSLDARRVRHSRYLNAVVACPRWVLAQRLADKWKAFSPRIADLTDTRFWRADAGADYGALDALARHRVNLTRVVESWPDMLRVAGSLATGTVRAYDLMRMLSRDGHPSRLGQAFTEYGRIAKTLHLLSYIDADDTYRRQTSRQLTVNEGCYRRHVQIFGC
jgi:TnpA family transposase